MSPMTMQAPKSALQNPTSPQTISSQSNQGSTVVTILPPSLALQAQYRLPKEPIPRHALPPNVVPSNKTQPTVGLQLSSPMTLPKEPLARHTLPPNVVPSNTLQPTVGLQLSSAMILPGKGFSRNSQQPVISNSSFSRQSNFGLPPINSIQEQQITPSNSSLARKLLPSPSMPSMPMNFVSRETTARNTPMVLIHQGLQGQPENSVTPKEVQICDQHIVDIQEDDDNTPSKDAGADPLLLETEETPKLAESEDMEIQEIKEEDIEIEHDPLFV
eukprot:TRINITY_DN5452_c0_g1_i7.p1 TRINITY_DN5452_c0_g1~~TRINITY_DN5452_c0_g1_i7.p1  ORF type:complete len:310 (-),score=28.57 TRINITY_DN5452_c0_g1_i7:158-976(-)